MKQYPRGSYEETRQFMFRRFRRLTADQKLDWLSSMVAFVDEVNPGARRRRLGLPVPHRMVQRRKRSWITEVS